MILIDLLVFHILQTNSYQAIVSTDGTQSFALFTYQCGSMMWSGNATIGFNAGGTFYRNQNLSRTGRINDVACQNYPGAVWSNLVYRLPSFGE